MAASYDINHAPPGGFQKGAWYWDPQAGQARRWSGSRFGNPGEVIAVDGESAVTSGSTPNTQPSNPLQQVNSMIQDSFQKLQDEVVKKFGEYRSGKPFNVDEVLAEKTKAAAEQIDPYYNQILGDYLTGVQRKIDRGVNDTKDLLSELSSSVSSYTEKAANVLSNAIEQADKGYADSGLFGSGDQMRAEGQSTQQIQGDVADYMRKSDLQRNQLTTGLNRNIEDINLDKKNYVTNLEQNRYTDTQTRAGQLTKEAGQQYIQGFNATLPPSLQSANGFDMLKSLGIYG